jgi:hypothetical protein
MPSNVLFKQMYGSRKSKRLASVHRKAVEQLSSCDGKSGNNLLSLADMNQYVETRNQRGIASRTVHDNKLLLDPCGYKEALLHLLAGGVSVNKTPLIIGSDFLEDSVKSERFQITLYLARQWVSWTTAALLYALVLHANFGHYYFRLNFDCCMPCVASLASSVSRTKRLTSHH